MKKKLLLVEDETLIALNERVVLQKNGYSVETASSGEAAVKYMNEHGEDVDLILMDINLGEMTGPQAARKILEKFDIPIVFLSSHTEKEIVDKIRNITNYGYIAKNSGEFVLVESIQMAFTLYDAYREAKENEVRYKSLFDDAPIGIFKTSSDGRIIDLNDKLANILGYESTAELKEKNLNVSQLYKHPQNRKEFIRKLEEDGHIENFEIEMYCRNGDPKWVSLSAKVGDAFKESFTIDGFLIDIHEEKAKTEELKRIEERFNSLFDKMNDGVAIYKPIDDGTDFVFQDLNKVGEKLSRIRKKDVIGKRIAEVFPGIADFGMLEALKNTYKTGETKHLPLSKYKDERIVQWVENTIYKLHNDEIVTIYSDTTEKKRTEVRLRETIQNLQTTLDSIGDGVVVVDKEKNIIDVNPTAEKLLGCFKAGCVGENIDDYFRIFDRDGLPAENPIDNALKNNETFFLDDGVSLKSIDGREYYIADSAAPLKDIDGEVRGVVLVFRDVSDSKKREDEKAKIAAEIAHRVKNNILLVRSLIQLKFQNEDISDIMSQIDAIQIVNEKLQNAEFSTDIEIRSYFQDLLETIFNNFYKERVDIFNTTEETFLNSKTTVSLGLILNELATNAMKHGFNTEPKFYVSMSKNLEEYTLVVSNNGNSIPEGAREGLGLQIIKSQVEQLRGNLEVNKENCMFTIKFPVE